MIGDVIDNLRNPTTAVNQKTVRISPNDATTCHRPVYLNIQSVNHDFASFANFSAERFRVEQ